MRIAALTEITPGDAAALLARSPRRPVDAAHLAELMAILRRGEWRSHASPIVIRHDGTIQDGHHRLTAIRDTGQTVTAVIVYDAGLP
jgi:ParB-like chromosome segregation protein Spo0J